MKTSIERKPHTQVEAQALVIPVFEGERPERFVELFDNGEVSGKSMELTLVHHPQGLAAKRVLLAGAGKREKFNSSELRKLCGAAIRYKAEIRQNCGAGTGTRVGERGVRVGCSGRSDSGGLRAGSLQDVK